MVFYSTVIHKLPGSIIGLAIGISVIWDAVSDPIMGHISDNTDSKKFGRRHFYILIGAISIAFFNLLLWELPLAMPAVWKIVLVITLLLIVKTSSTVYSVPHTALGAELSDDYNERSSIQGIRTIFFVLGLFSANVMGMFLFFAYSRVSPGPDESCCIPEYGSCRFCNSHSLWADMLLYHKNIYRF